MSELLCRPDLVMLGAEAPNVVVRIRSAVRQRFDVIRHRCRRHPRRRLGQAVTAQGLSGQAAAALSYTGATAKTLGHRSCGQRLPKL
jgi:hypothetical protein